MRKKAFFRKWNNEKGVAAVLVLAVILVLTALGTVALLASAANVSMGSKSRVWSVDFYKLDSAAESCVQGIDNKLSDAENIAREYVQYKYYSTATAPTSLSAIGFTADAQTFINNRFQAQLCKVGGDILTLDECIADPTQLSLAPTADAGQVKDEYTKRIKDFNSQTFNIVYFYFASKKLDDLDATSSEISLKQLIPSMNLCTTKFTGITASDDWTAKQPNNNDLTVYIDVNTGIPGDTKKVKVEMDVIVPDYKTVLQKMNVSYKGNPIWSNAISAQGEIKVESSHAVIQGDVYSSGAGVNAVTNAAIDIYGNVYSAGDVHVSGSGGRIGIYSHDTASTSGTAFGYKKKIYDNGLAAYDNGTDVYFDKVRENVLLASYTTIAGIKIDNLIEGSTTIPLVFIDSTGWGNVYCRNLAVDEGITSSSIRVDGNLWTSDDIEMNGKGSTIEVGFNGSTSAIGLQTDSTPNNPEESSSIINNYPESDGVNGESKIVLNGNIVVPGVAFYDFDSGPVTYGGRAYYKTLESVSAKVSTPTAIFNAYLSADTSIAPFERDGGEYFLTTSSAISEGTLKAFVDGKGIRTNIITGTTTPSGYVVKSSITQKDSISPAVSYRSDEIDKAGFVNLDYTRLWGSGVIMDLFQAKTKGFGLGPSYRGKLFEDYVNKSAPGTCPKLLIYDSSDHFLNTDLIDEGIVYSEGNLTIIGSGTFNGTIICEKNVTISGNATIVYNESIIATQHEKYAKVRSFFSKEAMGADNYYEDYSTQSGTRTQVKRYKIVAWKEQQG